MARTPQRRAANSRNSSGRGCKSRLGESVSALRVRYVDEENLTPYIPFERYADDVICHCKSAEEAQALWSGLAHRFAACKLMLHPEKTKIVYCKDANRRCDFPIISFYFPGFEFRARKTMWRKARSAFSQLRPAASPKALTFISRTIRRWTLQHSSDKTLPNLAEDATRAFEAGSTTTAISTQRSCVRP